MNRRILLVDDDAETLAAVRDALGDEVEVHDATNAQEALWLCAHRGPYALVVTDHVMPGRSGLELLEELAQAYPDTVRVLQTGSRDPDLAVETLNRAQAFRFLRKPLVVRELRETVQAAFERFERASYERLLVEQLRFSRETLEEFTAALEGRLKREKGRRITLERFVHALNAAGSLEEVAALAADACSEALDGRGVRVVLDGGDAESSIERSARRALSTEVKAVPMLNLEGEVGYLLVDRKGPSGVALSDSDHGVVDSIASAVATAAYLHLHRVERDFAQHTTIYALARLAENRDDDTGKHLQRVSEYCRMLAEGLRDAGEFVDILTPSYIHDLVLSAPLHDLGKVGIPDSILLKPGKLSEEEWTVMRTHTTIGAETLRQVLESRGEQSYVRMALEIAWCHHEKWSGAGYPRGLVEEEIPLCARIVALADCYDALTTVRPYKDAWPHEEARAWLVEQKGAHFDPRIIEAFLACEEDFNGVRGRLADKASDFTDATQAA